ncbi:MAG: DUF3024 domain-containing protein, partial [Rhodococcus sp. (in: high G+C Gram-positive bacteria)]
IARLSYTKKTGLWTLYWRDRNLKFHRYQFLAPSPHVQDLLDHIENGAIRSSGADPLSSVMR